MDPIIGGALIGAGANLVGGAVQGASNKKEGKRAWRRTKVLNQNQIQWRVNDAKAAGIHPLAALGMSPIGNAAPATGSVMGDALANAGQTIGSGVAAYGANKEARAMNQAALAESQARTAASLAQARRDISQAEYSDQMAYNAALARFKSPGRPNTNTGFGPTYQLKGKVPRYLDPATDPYKRPISQAHAQMLEDVSPGAVSGEPVVVHGANGFQMEVDPSWTPGGLLEELLGESGGFISFLNLLNSLPGATVDKKNPWWATDPLGAKLWREKQLQMEERLRKSK